MNIILFGPPGAGKGTQSQYLVNKLNNFQISTGDILRSEIKNDTVVGKQIINDMNEGKFVSDEIVNQLIEKLIHDPKKKDKFIFDGYPRSLSQARNLDLLLDSSNQTINHIFFLNVNKDTIIKRIKERSALEKRDDDSEEIAIKRYETYEKNIKPVIDFYKQSNLLKDVNGESSIIEINNEISALIESIKGWL